VEGAERPTTDKTGSFKNAGRGLVKFVSEAAASSSDKVIEIQNLSLTFKTSDGPVFALDDISLNVKRGDFVSFIGPSGCGKTTLLRTIADLEKATDGDIAVNGVTPEQARMQRAYGYVFQAASLYPWRNIAKNVALPLEIMGLSSAERRDRVQKNLELVNLSGFEKKYPWQLSGGMQQRASIARALAVEPDLLLMDEPFGALDEIVRDHLMSPRPGRIHEVIESNLPRIRQLDIRETPEFLALANRVRDGLRAGHSYED